MSFISRLFSCSSSQSSSQSSYKAQTIQVAPKKLPFSFLWLRDPSIDWERWGGELNSHITLITALNQTKINSKAFNKLLNSHITLITAPNQTKINSTAFNKLLVVIGNLLHTHMRQTRTCRDPFARDVRDKIESLIKALGKNRLVIAERDAFVKNPTKIPLSIKLIRLAEKVMPLTHQTCAWDKMPLVIKITILAQGLQHETREGRDVALQIIRNEITVNRALGDDLLVQYIRESNCSNLEWQDFNSRELATLVTQMGRTGLRNRISFMGLEESSITWRFYREYCEHMRSQKKTDWSLLMSAMNSDDRQPSLGLLSEKERDYLIHNLSSIRHLGHTVNEQVTHMISLNKLDVLDETAYILSFLRKAVAHDSKQGFALWARTIATSYLKWDRWVVHHHTTRLTQAEIEGIVENMDSIPQINWPSSRFGPTWQAIFRTAFNKGLNGHLESWRQIARLINYHILENCPKQRDVYWMSLNWQEILMPWSTSVLPLEDLPLAFKELITHLNLPLNDENFANLEKIIETFPNLTALCIVADSSRTFILPKNCKNLEVLILENVDTILEDMPNLRMLRLRKCDSIIFSANYYGCLQEMSLANCPYLFNLPYTPSLTKLQLNAVPIKDIGVEKIHLQELILKDCFVISNLPRSLEKLTTLDITEGFDIEGKIRIKPLSLAPELLIQLLPGKNCLLPFNIIKKNPVLWFKIFHGWVHNTESWEELKEGLKKLNFLSIREGLFDFLDICIKNKHEIEIEDAIRRLTEMRVIFHRLHNYYKWHDIYLIEQSFAACLQKIWKVPDSRFDKHFFNLSKAGAIGASNC